MTQIFFPHKYKSKKVWKPGRILESSKPNFCYLPFAFSLHLPPNHLPPNHPAPYPTDIYWVPITCWIMGTRPGLSPRELVVDSFINNICFLPFHGNVIPCSKSDIKVIYLIPGYNWVCSSLSPVADPTYCSQLSAKRVMVPRQGMWERKEGEGQNTHPNSQRYNKDIEGLFP